MNEYKVLTEQDSRFSGKFDPEGLQATLNSHAAEGWRVVDSVTSSSTWKNTNASIMIILEREATGS